MDKMVSVVIPVYNAGNYIIESIESVFDQDYKNIQIVVVNDGSTDDSLSKIENTFADRIKIINIDNSGVSNARNVGILNSDGDYIAFLDADDFWVKDKISCQIASFEMNERFGVSYTSRYIITSDGNIIEDKRKRFSGNIFNKILVRNFVCLSSVMVKKECLEECGNFDTSLSVSEDYDLWIRISSRYNFVYVDMGTSRWFITELLPEV